MTMDGCVDDEMMMPCDSDMQPLRMTFDELLKRPIGTTYYFARRNKYAEGRPELAFVAAHWERIQGGIRPKRMFGATLDEAFEKAADYDRKRKALFATWRESAKKRSNSRRSAVSVQQEEG